MSLREYVELRIDSEYWHMVSNQQARRLPGRNGPAEIHPEDADTLAELSKQNIEAHFRVAGTTERFDTRLLLIKDSFGWDGHVYYRKRNKTGRPPTVEDIDPDTHQLIRRHNKADLALYDWVDQELTDSVKAVGSLDLDTFRTVNQIYGTYRKGADYVRQTTQRVCRQVFTNKRDQN